jgi:Na+/proline symporter
MGRLDWTVLVAYFAVIAGVGAWAGRRNRGLTDYFLGGREMPWWAVGLSVMATQISAITIVSTTGQAYVDGTRFLVVYFGLPIAMVILCATLLPFYHRAQVFTAYEYLERRFSPATRTLTSFLFLVSRGLAVGVTLYAPSLVLSVVMGWNERATILVMGATTVLYVLWGGNRSVIWTDVVQMIIIWVGIFVCVVLAVHNLPPELSLRDALVVGKAAGRLRTLDPSPSLTRPYTLWEGLVAGTFLALAYFGCDQSQVQRYLSGRSLREMRLSLLFNAAVKIPMQALILFTGAMVFVFYHFHPIPLLWNPSDLRRWHAEAPAADRGALEQDWAAAQEARRRAALALVQAAPEARAAAEAAYVKAERGLQDSRAPIVRRVAGGGKYNDTNYVFLTYVLAFLPNGLKGLILAVIFAAAMSTLSGELAALASASMIDFYKRFVPAAPHHDLLVSRAFTVFWGLAACLVAMRAGQLGSAIEAVNQIGSYFYGSILGVFALAVLVPRARAAGALSGLIAGTAVVALVARLTSVHFLWYNVIGAVIVLIVGSLHSLRVPSTFDLAR